MIKRICSFIPATAAVALMTACGATDTVLVDLSDLSSGDTNQVSIGGYWWTYTDHQTDAQFHSEIVPVTSADVPLVPEMDSDAAHGHVIRVHGQVPGKLDWADVSGASSPELQAKTVDPHWLAQYPDSRVPNYPSAGLGFGYLPHNQQFDATMDNRYVGIAFDMKIAESSMASLYVSMPTTDTDLNDPSNEDKFQHTCRYYTDPDNRPSNTGGVQTCFVDYRKLFSVDADKASNKLEPGWHRYCVLFSEVGKADFPTNDPTMEAIADFNPKHAIKVKWDFFQPDTGEDPAKFDISVDNLKLMSDVTVKDPKNNCNPDFMGDKLRKYGSGDPQ